MKTKHTLAALFTFAALIGFCAAYAPQALAASVAVTTVGGGALALLHLHQQCSPVSNTITIAEEMLTVMNGAIQQRVTEEAFASKYLLGKEGSGTNGVALNGAATKPIGPVFVDGSSVAIASGDTVSVKRLGAGQQCIVVASEAIAAGADVFTAASGKVQDEPATATTVYWIGTAVTAALADGDPIVIEPRPPIKLTIIANGSTLSQTQAAMASAGLVKVL